jgi:hypothetical protein
MRKSTKGRIKPYGYNCIQPISGLLSLTSQLKSGRDRWWQECKEGGSAPATRSALKDKELGAGDRSVGTFSEFCENKQNFLINFLVKCLEYNLF